MLAIELLAACDRTGRAAGTANVSDSAGVRLVVNHATDGWRDGAAWTVTTYLTIGTEPDGRWSRAFGTTLGARDRRRDN